MSCDIRLNIAKHGVIFGINSVNIASINSSFTSNYAAKSGTVFHLMNSCLLINDGSTFQNNSAQEHGGVAYAMHNVTIDNTNSLFQYNNAETGDGSMIWMQDGCQLNNQQVYMMLLFAQVVIP